MKGVVPAWAVIPTEPPSREQFNPDWTISPGTILDAERKVRGLKQAEFGALLGLPQQHVSRLLLGVAHLKPEVALKLEGLGWGTAEFWVTAEARYRLDLARGCTALAMRSVQDRDFRRESSGD